MHPLEHLLACPTCHGPLRDLACAACGDRLVRRDGWLVDAVGEEALPSATRSRFEVFGKPLVARLYDVDVRLASGALYGASVSRQAGFLADALAAAAGAGRPLLDVPGGSGVVLARALRHGRSRPPLVIADLSVPMLARTRARLGDDPLYVRADVARLPFASGTFGAVHSGNGFHLFPDPQAAACELARVTRADGEVRVTTWVQEGRRIPGWWMRVLAWRGLCNDPRPREHFEALLSVAGLEQASSHTSGSVLLWSGCRSPAAPE